MLYIGTAGWTIPSQLRDRLRRGGSHLSDYSKAFNCVEINSSFYRNHQAKTYARWQRDTPAYFRFSVKLSRRFTHENPLIANDHDLVETLSAIAALEEKLGAILIQLPPSLPFRSSATDQFLEKIRKHYLGPIVWEPRHVSWEMKEAVELLSAYEISKVEADPERCNLPKECGTRLRKIRYLRLHGNPHIYRSRYSLEALEALGRSIEGEKVDTWVIFDNTTFGFATENAIELMDLVPMVQDLQLK